MPPNRQPLRGPIQFNRKHLSHPIRAVDRSQFAALLYPRDTNTYRRLMPLCRLDKDRLSSSVYYDFPFPNPSQQSTCFPALPKIRFVDRREVKR
jgi:hypothetical protein